MSLPTSFLLSTTLLRLPLHHHPHRRYPAEQSPPRRQPQLLSTARRCDDSVTSGSVSISLQRLGQPPAALLPYLRRCPAGERVTSDDVTQRAQRLRAPVYCRRVAVSKVSPLSSQQLEV